MRVLLLRHAEALGNAQGRFIGVTDSPLTAQGILQAQTAALSAPCVRHVYVSPLARCIDTAKVLWPDIGHTVIEELRESDFGPFEGKNHSELSGGFLYESWLKNAESAEVKELVESPEKSAVRAAEAWNKIIDDAEVREYDIVSAVSHGGTLMSILNQYAYPERDYYEWKMGNCRGFMVEVRPGERCGHVISEFPEDRV